MRCGWGLRAVELGHCNTTPYSWCELLGTTMESQAGLLDTYHVNGCEIEMVITHLCAIVGLYHVVVLCKLLNTEFCSALLSEDCAI